MGQLLPADFIQFVIANWKKKFKTFKFSEENFANEEVFQLITALIIFHHILHEDIVQFSIFQRNLCFHVLNDAAICNTFKKALSYFPIKQFLRYNCYPTSVF